MIFYKAKKIFHRLVKSFSADKIIYWPAIVFLILALSLIGFVFFSDTNDFAPCTMESIGCTENINELSKPKQIKKIFVCAVKTAWCDTQVLFQKCSKKNNTNLLKDETEPNENNLSSEELNKLFEKINSDFEKDISKKVDGKKLMEEARKERLDGEKHFQELINNFVQQHSENTTNENK